LIFENQAEKVSQTELLHDVFAQFSTQKIQIICGDLQVKKSGWESKISLMLIFGNQAGWESNFYLIFSIKLHGFYFQIFCEHDKLPKCQQMKTYGS
jgi:hypothetical protein